MHDNVHALDRVPRRIRVANIALDDIDKPAHGRGERRNIEVSNPVPAVDQKTDEVDAKKPRPSRNKEAGTHPLTSPMQDPKYTFPGMLLLPIIPLCGF